MRGRQRLHSCFTEPAILTTTRRLPNLVIFKGRQGHSGVIAMPPFEPRTDGPLFRGVTAVTKPFFLPNNHGSIF